MDTGSGHDLISRRKVAKMELEPFISDPITFHTADGPTVSDHSLKVDIGTLDEPAIAHVLDDTPSVLYYRSAKGAWMKDFRSFGTPGVVHIF